MKSSAIVLSIILCAALGALLAWNQVRSEFGRDQTEPVLVIEGPLKHVVTPPMLETTRAMTQQSAPAMTAVASDGQTYSLVDSTHTEPIVVIFIKDGCPCSEAAQPYFNALYDAYGPHVRFFGVMDSAPEIAQRWAKRHRAKFPILCDLDRKIIREYRAESSAYLAIVAADGTIEKYWPGYSEGMLREVGERLARLAAVPVAPIDLTGAPDELYAGCPYELDEAL